MFSVGAIQATLGINTSDYTRGILNANALNAAFGQTFTNFVTNPIAGGIEIMQKFAGGALQLFGERLGRAEEIQRFGEAVGVNVELLQALRAQAEEAGHGLNVVDMALRTFANRVGASHAQFQQLGIDLQGLDVEQALRQTLDALDQLDPATRAYVGGLLLGEEAALKFFNTVGGGAAALDEVIDRQKRLNQVTGEERINALAESNTQIGRMLAALEGAKNLAADGFLENFFEGIGLGSADAEELGVQLGDKIVPAFERLGRILGERAGDLDEIVEKVARLAGHVETIVDLIDILTGNNKVANFLGDVLTPTQFQIDTRQDFIFLQQQRDQAARADAQRAEIERQRRSGR